jgi:Zn-dependent alcohol dehydrogenase
MPPGLPLARAALIGCGVATGVGAALHTAGVQPGDSVAVFGVGGVGLNVVQGARLALASTIIAVDPAEPKRKLALQFGATHAIDPVQIDPVEAVMRLTVGRGVDHAFDVVGLPSVADQALQTLAQGGGLTLVGNAARDVQVSFYPRLLLSKQQSIRGCVYGSCRPPVDFPLLAEWHLGGQLRLEELVTRTITLVKLPEVFQAAPEPAGIRTVVGF